MITGNAQHGSVHSNHTDAHGIRRRRKGSQRTDQTAKTDHPSKKASEAGNELKVRKTEACYNY